MLDELVDARCSTRATRSTRTRPGATKNATPTPFGIVYPPAYAAECDGAFDHARLECVAEAGAGATLTRDAALPAAERRAPPGGRAARRARAGRDRASARPSTFDGGRFTLRSRAARRTALRGRARACTTPPRSSRGSTAARRSSDSLLSTHIVRPRRRRAASSRRSRRGRASVNTCPVLATPSDDAVLGAAIVLPDHPQIAPESRGNLFDTTEIEEALLLHVHALSDDERAADRRRRTRPCAR